MTIFNTEYFSTLDRGYYSPQTIAAAKDDGTFIGGEFPEAKPIETSLTAMEIGTTMAPDTYPIQELQAKIRAGAAKLEIAFAGAGKSGFGGRGSTPEVIGRREREEFREMARINNVKVSTHATFGKQGLSGLTQQGFSEEEAQKTLKEINKAIEFAATATQGGAVVFHAGEWQRPIMDAGLKDINGITKDDPKRKFQEFEKEFEKAPIYLADERTGQIQAITRDMKFYFPEEEYDPKTGMKYLKKSKDGNEYEVKEYDFHGALEFIKKRHEKDKKLEGKSDGEILMFGLREQQLREAEGQALRFSDGLDDQKKLLQKIIEKREVEERIWNETPEKDRWKLMEREQLGRGMYGEYIPHKDLLKQQEDQIRQHIIGNQSTVTSALEQQKRILSEMNRFKPIEEVGIKRTADTLAKAGIKAMDETERHKKELKESIYIAPENLFPDFYGSNADEMIRIVEESRKDMAKKLHAKGYSEDVAKAKAQEHIRATLDTGHLNEWRQHWKGNEKDFKKWYLDQVQKMVDKKVLGHIHLTDNWGYDDEHLTPGQGNTPTKEVVKMLENAGFKDFITEVGSFNANTIMADTLSELGSPIYAAGRHPMPNRSWGQMRHGHFGYAAPPNYIVGAYSPSNEFKLWSEVPLE